VAKNVIGKIVSRFEAAGLKIVAAKLVQLSRAPCSCRPSRARTPSPRTAT
jgi:nucleoside diphosphate kinase